MHPRMTIIRVRVSGTSGEARWDWSTYMGKNATRNAAITPTGRVNRLPMR